MPTSHNSHKYQREILEDFSDFWNAILRGEITEENNIAVKKSAGKSQVINLSQRKFAEMFESKKSYDSYVIYMDKWIEIWLYRYLSSTTSNKKETKENVFERISQPCLDTLCSILNKQFANSVEDFDKILKDLSMRIIIVVEKVQASTSYLALHAEVAENVDALFDTVYDEINRIDKQVERLKTGTSNLKNELTTAQNELSESSKKHAELSITILGIFVAIVVVFFGDFSIIDSVLNLETENVYRFYFTVLFVTFVLYNSAILLLFLIGRLTGRSMSCKCFANPTCTDCTTCTKRRCLCEICSLRNNYPYVYWINSLFLVGFTFLFWLYLGRNGNDITYIQLQNSGIFTMICVSIFICAESLPVICCNIVTAINSKFKGNKATTAQKEITQHSKT